MKDNRSIRRIAVLGVAVLAVAGCSGHEDDITKQMADAKKLPPPTSAQLQQGWDQMAANQRKSKEDEKAWAAAHPDKVAEVNAARAAGGKPPLGQ